MTLIPNFETATITNPASSAGANKPNEVALRKAAEQFEALLLTQLTASLNPKDEDEDALFSNSGGGMGLARQMYSEQLAKTMAESGGVGIADMIISQVLKRNAQPTKGNVNHLTELALSSIREIKSEAISSSEAKTNAFSSKAPHVFTNAKTSEASMSAVATAARTSASSDSVSSPLNPASPNGQPVWSGPNDSRAPMSATRPRRVYAIEGATVSNEAPANPALAPALSAASSERNLKTGGAYVSYQSPLQGEIRSRFGMRRDPINGRMRLHKGIDIPAQRGTPIEASAAGTVVFADRNKGYGKMVMIEHADGRRTLYAHAQSLFVKAGDTVAAGQTIAAVGSTGHSTGPHLHFEIRESNRSINPLKALAKALSNDIAMARR